MLRLGLIVPLLLVSTVADAKVLELYGQAQGGGGTGRGIAGAQKDFDFFQKSGGAAYGSAPGAMVTTSSAALALSTQTMLR